MDFFKFLASKIFWRNVLCAIAASIALLIFILLVLKVYTRHGKSKPVPNFKGLTLQEVQRICKKNKLDYQITDSVFLISKNRGTVVDQNPAPNFKVKKNRTIFLIINANNPELVELPRIKGISFRQAKAALEAKGLRIGKLEYVRDIAINNVLDVKQKGKIINYGTVLPKYSSVDLILGDGFGHHRTYVPNLIGKQAYEAKGKIIDAYCNVGSIIYDRTVKNYSDSAIAFIFRQFPEFSSRSFKHGTYVDIWLTMDANKIVLDTTNSNNKKIDEE